MEWKDLAAWITVAITLALSILVPLFTQMCNNRFQIKKAEQDYKHRKEEYEQQRHIDAYENFLKSVGAAIEYRNDEAIRTAGSSIGQIYLYVPCDFHKKLDALYTDIRTYKWGEAEAKYLELAKLIREENEKIKTMDSL